MKTVLKGARNSIFLAVAVSLVLSSCGSPPTSTDPTPSDDASKISFEQLVDLAKKEGSLTFYTVDSYGADIAAAFTEKYGIVAQPVRLSSSELMQRFSSEKQAGVVGADLLQLFDTTIVQENPDWFVKLDQYPLPALEGIEPSYVSEYFSPMVLFPSSLNYNTDNVPPSEVPTTYEDLLDSRFKGRMLFINPEASATPVGLLNLLRAEYGDDFIRKLGEQDMTYVDTTAVGIQQIASGAYDVMWPASGGSQSEPAKAKGAPVDYTILDPIQVGSNGPALPAGAEHPYAAALFANFMLTPEAMKVVCDNNPQYALPLAGGKSLPGCPSIKSEATPVNFGFANDQDARRELIDLFEGR